jgi:hypothetical protein
MDTINNQQQITFTTPISVEPNSLEQTNNNISDNQINKQNIYAYPSNINVISNDENQDIIKFEIIFNVMIFDGSKFITSSVKKIFEINKQNLASEMLKDLSSEKVITIEHKENKRLNNRVRELAGIPGKGTFV